MCASVSRRKICRSLPSTRNLPVIAIRTPKVGELSRKERDDIKPMFHSKGGAKRVRGFQAHWEQISRGSGRFAKKIAMEEGDLIVLVAGSAQTGPQTAMPAHRKVTPAELAIYASAGLLRLALAQKYADRHGIFKKTGDPAKDYRFLWVTNFPMFEWDEGEKQLDGSAPSVHVAARGRHESARTGVDSVKDPQSTLSAVRALAYDVVLNGTELGSGSIRIHRQDIQSKIFQGFRHDRGRSQVAFRILSRSA